MIVAEIDPCSDKPCLNGGTCSPTADDFNCTCPDAYTGDLCNDGKCIFYILVSSVQQGLPTAYQCIEHRHVFHLH